MMAHRLLSYTNFLSNCSRSTGHYSVRGTDFIAPLKKRNQRNLEEQ